MTLILFSKSSPACTQIILKSTMILFLFSKSSPACTQIILKGTMILLLFSKSNTQSRMHPNHILSFLAPLRVRNWTKPTLSPHILSLLSSSYIDIFIMINDTIDHINVCVCVCVCERERDRDRDREKEKFHIMISNKEDHSDHNKIENVKKYGTRMYNRGAEKRLAFS